MIPAEELLARVFRDLAELVVDERDGPAGVGDGDVLLLVNGISPQVEEGALLLNTVLFNKAELEQPLRFQVRRDGKLEKITLKK